MYARKTLIAILACLALLTACTRTGEQMRDSLAELERMNSADSTMTDDSLAEAVVRYFDDHGTANERMRAHYILGRTYADLGELPHALEEFLAAASAADTASADCDYIKLCRVHAQTAKAYHSMIQPRSQLEELRKAQYYAWKARDTAIAIECFAQTSDAYSMLHKPDSVISIREKASEMYAKAGFRMRSVITLGNAIRPKIETGDIIGAKKIIDSYEQNSGLFDDEGKIKKGREMYYYTKGLYYLSVGKTDSAETMFRMLERYARTLNHEIAYCKGLQEVYTRRVIPDSIAKYATLGYMLNDSAYSLSEMENIQKFAAVYNYNRNKLLAEQKTEETQRKKAYLTVVISLFVMTIVLAAFIINSMKKKRQLQEMQYRNNLMLLEKAQTELMELYAAEEQSKETIESLAADIRRYERQIISYKKIRQKNKGRLETDMMDSPAISHLKELLELNPPQLASNKDFVKLKQLINESIPDFYTCVFTSGTHLRNEEYIVCILVRLHFSPSEISKLMGWSSDYVANMRKRLLKKVFNVEGKGKEFDERILEIV